MTKTPTLEEILQKAIDGPLSEWAELRGIQGADDVEVAYDIIDRKTGRMLGHVVAVNAPQAIKNWARENRTSVDSLYRQGASLEARRIH